MEKYLEFWSTKTNLITWISVGAIVLTIAAILLVCSYKKNISTNTVVYAGVTLAASFALSFFAKVSFVPNGGSITLASMLPVFIFAYVYGFRAGLLTGMIYGLLQFISAPFILTPETFLLDYLLAFMTIALVGIFKKRFKNIWAFALGVSVAYFARFFFHFVSGLLYYFYGSVWATSLPTQNAFIYSFMYNLTYILPDYAINIIAILALSAGNTFEKLIAQIEKSIKALPSKATASQSANSTLEQTVSTSQNNQTANTKVDDNENQN